MQAGARLSAFVFIVVILTGALAQARAEVNGWPWYRAVPAAVVFGLLCGGVAYEIGSAL